MFQGFELYGKFPVEKLSTLCKIGEGLGRTVYALDEHHCLKYPRWQEGETECRIEAKIFQEADKKFQKLLCPVVFDGNGYVIMKKAVPIGYVRATDTIYQYSTSRNIKNLINYLVEKFDLWRPDVEKISQWGYVDGKLVLLDYGRNMDLMKDCHI